jgi:putative DNA primase/helicase
MQTQEEASPQPERREAIPEDRYTDLWNAQRLITRHGSHLRYVAEWGWMVWEGTRWKRDETGQVMEHAKESVLSLYVEAATMHENDARRKAYVTHAKSSEARARLEAAVALAMSDPRIAATPQQFDRNPWLLTVLNGTIDLRTGELHEPDPADLITRLAPQEYKPDARSEVWERFLSDLFPGDAEMVAFMQRAAGYTLTGLTREHAFFIAYGSGRNGKSTLFTALKKVLGDYAATTQAQTILRRERTGGIPNDLAALAGARLATVSETDSGMALNVGLVKQLTGGDDVTARFLNKEFFTFSPQMKFWLMTNNKPDIPESTRAIWERIKLIPFEQDFTGREDREMDAKLEAAGEAILAWAVAGCLAWQREGLNPPEKVRAATQAYQEEQDLLADFLSERTQEGGEVQARTLYTDYKDWCESQTRPLSEREFSAQMLQRGYKKARGGNNVRVYQGVSLRSRMTVLPFPPYSRPEPVAVGLEDDFPAY